MHKHGLAILQVAKAPLLPPPSARGAEKKAQRQSSGGGVRWNAFFSWSARFSGAVLALPQERRCRGWMAEESDERDPGAV